MNKKEQKFNLQKDIENYIIVWPLNKLEQVGCFGLENYRIALPLKKLKTKQLMRASVMLWF